uniref:Secreted protein n=1 Tax=Canis lupus familiaris TaxID=9615 RepID=A0A8C0S6W5_CANLF
MAWKTLWRIQAWCNSSWTSCLPLSVVSMRRHAHSSCSCLTSLPSAIRSCCAGRKTDVAGLHH